MSGLLSIDYDHQSIIIVKFQRLFITNATNGWWLSVHSLSMTLRHQQAITIIVLYLVLVVLANGEIITECDVEKEIILTDQAHPVQFRCDNNTLVWYGCQSVNLSVTHMWYRVVDWIARDTK
jgi:hypothetical protein